MPTLIEPDSKTAAFDRKLGRAILWLLSLIFVVLFIDVAQKTVVEHDFITYWSSAKLLASHANPYDSQAIWNLEKVQGNQRAAPYLMRNPPWILPLIAPLGYMSLRAAIVWWVLFEMVLTFVSIRLLLPPGGYRKIPWIGYLFFPLLLCLICGQTTIFPLFGCALYLWAVSKRPMLAGVGLALIAIKPHLALFFWPILLIESWRKKEFRALITGVAVLGCAIGAALLLDVHVFQHYLEAMRAEHIESQFLPNIACWFRMLLAPRILWVQLIPIVCGTIWAIIFYWQRRNGWSWAEYLPLLIAASAFLSPYSWIYDQTMLLPLLLQWSIRQSTRLSQVIAIVANALPSLLMLSGVPPKSPFFVVFPLAWLLWWTILRHRSQVIQKHAIAVSA